MIFLEISYICDMKEDNANKIENITEDVVMCICGRSRDGLCHCTELSHNVEHHYSDVDDDDEYLDIENDDEWKDICPK